MLVLLPPSESKTAPDAAARAFAPEELWAPDTLGAQRTQIRAALAIAAGLPGAGELLGFPPSVAPQAVEWARDLAPGATPPPAAPVSDVYTGVLYQAANFGTLTTAQRLQADASVRVISALWGAVRLSDRIPAYRLSMYARIPGVPPLATSWRPLLDQALSSPDAPSGAVVDCRSTDYVAAWRPPHQRPPHHRPWLTVIVVRQASDGRRTVVSHDVKHLRGVLAGTLVRHEGAQPESVDDVLQVARTLIGHAAGTGPSAGHVTHVRVEPPASGRGASKLVLVTESGPAITSPIQL